MNTVFRTCDECGEPFEVDAEIAADMDYFNEHAGDPYVCDCCNVGLQEMIAAGEHPMVCPELEDL